MKTKLEIDNLGDALIESMAEGLDHIKKKKRLISKKVELPDEPPLFKPQQIKKLRQEANLTIPSFARCLAVSVRTVEDWESGKNRPLGPARRLMEIFARDHDVFLRAKRENRKVHRKAS